CTYSSNRQIRLKPPLSRSSSSHSASHYSIGYLLARHVPVRGLHPIARGRQPLLHLFGDEDRPMLPARTPKSHREVAFALLDVVRQKKIQHIRGFVQKLRRLRKLTDVFRYLRMPPGQLAKLRHEVWIRQKPYIEHQVRF